MLQAQSEPVAHGVRNDLPRPFETYRDWGELPDNTGSWAAVTAVEPAPDGKQFMWCIDALKIPVKDVQKIRFSNLTLPADCWRALVRGFSCFPMEQRLITKETSG